MPFRNGTQTVYSTLFGSLPSALSSFSQSGFFSQCQESLYRNRQKKTSSPYGRISQTIARTAADRVLDTLNDQLTLLSAHPHLGRERPDIAPGLRYCISNNYLVLYRVIEEKVDIIRVLHGARNLPVLFEDEAEAA